MGLPWCTSGGWFRTKADRAKQDGGRGTGRSGQGVRRGKCKETAARRRLNRKDRSQGVRGGGGALAEQGHNAETCFRTGEGWLGRSHGSGGQARENRGRRDASRSVSSSAPSRLHRCRQLRAATPVRPRSFPAHHLENLYTTDLFALTWP
jgi:hypothetical protein